MQEDFNCDVNKEFIKSVLNHLKKYPKEQEALKRILEHEYDDIDDPKYRLVDINIFMNSKGKLTGDAAFTCTFVQYLYSKEIDPIWLYERLAHYADELMEDVKTTLKSANTEVN